MKIAIDARPLSSGDSVRGIGVYTRELIQAFRVLRYKDITMFEDGYGKTSEKFDLIHFTSFNPFVVSVPFTKPKGTKFVLTIYDLIPQIYPNHYPSGIRGLIKFSINKNLIKKNIDAILTISETSKKDVCRFFGVDPRIVHVVYLAPRTIFKPVSNTSILYSIEVKYKLPKKFVLYTGDVNYNKNIPILIEACKLAHVPLVIAGKQAKDINGLILDHPELKHLKNLDWSNVIRLGFVSDEDLVNIYNLASVYIQPSLYEGFGLPVLEAFACGIPVVVSKTQALVEIAEGAALFADPSSPKDFAEKIKLMVNDRKTSSGLIKKGFEKVKEFNWGKTAKQTFEIYSKILK